MDAPYPFSQPGLIPRAGRVLQGWMKVLIPSWQIEMILLMDKILHQQG